MCPYGGPPPPPPPVFGGGRPPRRAAPPRWRRAGGSRRQTQQLHQRPPHAARSRPSLQPCRGGGTSGRPDARLGVTPPVCVAAAAGAASVLPRRRGRRSTPTARVKRRVGPPLPPPARHPTGRGREPLSARPPMKIAAINIYGGHILRRLWCRRPPARRHSRPVSPPCAVGAGHQRSTRGVGANSEEARASRCARRRPAAAAGGVLGRRRRSRSSSHTRRRATARPPRVVGGLLGLLRFIGSSSPPSLMTPQEGGKQL